MAAAMTVRAPAPTLGDRLFNAVNNITGDWLARRLMESTALSTPKTRLPASIVGWNGVADVLGSKPLASVPSLRETAAASLAETIQESVNGIVRTLTPDDGLESVKRKLKSVGMFLYEKSGANMLFHQPSNTHHAAAPINPELNRFNMLKRDLNAELRKQVGVQNPASLYADGKWEQMAFSWGYNGLRPQDLVDERTGRSRKVLAYSAGFHVDKNKSVERKGYIGYVHAIASGDAQENLRIMREAAAKGYRLVLPEAKRGDATDGRLVEGMPILVSHKRVAGEWHPVSLPAEKVNPLMDMKLLAASWGKDMVDAYVEKLASAKNQGAMFAPRGAQSAPKAVPVEGYENVVDYRASAVAMNPKYQAFFDTILVKEPEPEALPGADDADDPIFMAEARMTDRDFRVRVNEELTDVYVYDFEEKAVLVDTKTGENTPVSKLPAGRYPLEDHFGGELGFTYVSNSEQVVHRSLRTKEEITFGPKPGADRGFDAGFEAGRDDEREEASYKFGG